MNYLRSYLKGDADNTLKGLKLSNDNYDIALKLLKDRYGDPQILISAHMNELLNFEPIGINDITYDINDLKDLRKLYDRVETQVRSLDNLGIEFKNYGPMLVPVLMSKLPTELKLIISRKFGKNLWDIQTIVDAFKNELEVRERIALASFENENPPHSGMSLYSGARNFSVRKQWEKKPWRKTQSQQGDFACVFCDETEFHKPQDCTVVTKPQARKRILMTKGHCYICMKPGHQARECRSNMTCFKCKNRHHVAICFSKINTQGDKHDQVVQKLENESISTNVANSTEDGLNLFKNDSVLLQTARAQVSSVNERNSKNLRILFDSGSQLSYISPRARDHLNLETICQKDISIKVFGKSQSKKTLDCVKFAVKSKDGNMNLYVDAFVNPVCYPIEGQKIRLATVHYPHLKGLELADDNPNNLPLDVDILIGGNHYWQFFNTTIIKGESGPVAMSSKLGYVLNGPVESSGDKISHTNVVHTQVLKIQSEFISEKIELKTTLKSFWDTENSTVSPIDKSVIESFEGNVKFTEGRYEVRFPFKESHEIWEDYYRTSVGRLKSLLTNTFKGNPELLHEYDRIINEQQNLNIIETAPETHEPGSTNYLPHRLIIRNDKSTTKVRMMFDASAKGKGPTLNDCLYAGPSLTPSLYGVLLRFRAHNIAVVGDIEKAFLQINLNPKDRDFVRFLWFENIENIDFDNFQNNKLVEYRLCRVLFGVASSPFLLSATLIHHVKKFIHEDAEFVEKLLNSLHVDDLNSGCDDVDSGFDFFVQCKNTLKEGSFNLRKFKSNSRDLEHMVTTSFPDDGIDSVLKDKVLGILWDRKLDELIINFDDVLSKVSNEPTKRNILQVIASMYDPLGLINPVVVEMKILFQEICLTKVKWDDPLQIEFLERWKNILNELKQTGDISVDRVYCVKDINDPFVKVELHGFSDASKRAYGCCIYLRFVHSSGKITTKLVTSKSRVNSLRNYSIPRLELQGAVLLFETLSNVIDEISKTFKLSGIFVWLDSSVVYCWIKNSEKTYKTFVHNRLEIIRAIIERSATISMKLVNSKDNPADIISRGMKPTMLKTSYLWFSGPRFLTLPEHKWPEFQVGDNFSSVEEKIRNSKLKSDDATISSDLTDMLKKVELVSDDATISSDIELIC